MSLRNSTCVCAMSLGRSAVHKNFFGTKSSRFTENMERPLFISKDFVHDCIAAMPCIIPQFSSADTWYFYKPRGELPRGVCIATIENHDDHTHLASAQDCEDLWRLSIGIPKATFLERFGTPPQRPWSGGLVPEGWDLIGVDKVAPHPVYGWVCWVAVVNPTIQTWADECMPLLIAAHERAQAVFEKRKR